MSDVPPPRFEAGPGSTDLPHPTSAREGTFSRHVGGDGNGVAPGVLDRLRQRRDAMLASPGFRRWAAAFPLTRPIARRRARALFDLCAGFVYSQILLACVRVKLFERLAQGPRSLPDIARAIDLPREATRRLLDAAVSLRLANRRSHDRYGLGPLGAAMLGDPGIVAMVEHHTLLYADLADPVALLRGERPKTQLSHYWAYAGTTAPEAVEDARLDAYTTLMAASQSFVAEQVLDAYPLGRHACLLDVGGGDGSFLKAAAARAPNLRLMLFDLPPVAARAARTLAEAGLGPRVQTAGGNFLTDALPTGADVISFVRVIHDHDDDAAQAILHAARAALPADGVVLVAEPMADTRGAEPIGDAYFGFYLLTMRSGRPRSRAQLTAMLHAAGFDAVRAVRTHMPMIAGLLVAGSRKQQRNLT